MKVVQLGCGVTGLVCAEHLEHNPKVDELVLADKQTQPAAELAERSVNDKTTLLKTDASDISDLKKLIKDCDLVVTSVPSDMNPKLLKAALAVGVDYVDFTIPMKTIEHFDEIGKACEDAGIRALTAVGSDPGISDVFAMHGASKLDEVHEIHIKDADNATSTDYEVFTLWCTCDMLDEITMKAAVYNSGKIHWLPPLSRKEIYNFPEPVGSHTVYNTTHDETFLIPKFIKGVKYVDFMIVVSDGLARLANVMRRLGLHKKKPVMVNGIEVKPLEFVAACLPNPVDMVGKIKGSAGIMVDAVGLRKGEKCTVRTWVGMKHEEAFKLHNSTATGYLVGTGAAIGAEMLVANDVKGSGLFVPEMLPIERYLHRMRGKGLGVHEEIVAM
ncbi:MAG: saccharopine dehydrogenase NADP-binding domain-containing protein [Thermoplasmata archaeon]|nr:saccharopine dehydrogenase NADP-binding domain-containing protein [Thermoplasmata archaeon]